MATLGNGIETAELGSTAWRIIYNNNFEALYTKDEIDNRTVDTTFTDSTKGVVLKDRTTDTLYSLFVNNGVLSIEVV